MAEYIKSMIDKLELELMRANNKEVANNLRSAIVRYERRLKEELSK
jgi:hypothetical protein